MKESLSKNYKNIETKLIHSGEIQPGVMGAVSMPVFQSSTFEYEGEEGYDAVRYIRLNNTPNHIVLNEKLASLENAEAAMVTSSGMAAITTALLTFLGKGDHLLAQNSLYGGTFDFITKDFLQYGIEYDLIDAGRPETWESKIKSNTKVIYVESITNPLIQVCDLKAVARFSKKHNLISMIDNTFTSPVNFRPVELGFDISLHSCTKYMNGHNDIVAGAAIGKAELIRKFSHKLGHLGGTLDPHTCYLLHRGLKTLALRVRYQNESALKIAQFLESHPKIKKVNYPGLKSNASYTIAKELFEGFGGMISFELDGGISTAEKLINSLTIPIYAPSLGGVETLIILPSKTSHAGLTKEERELQGISDGLIRLSVGIENPDDLIDDFTRALSVL
jgi:cystathionine beta-lyase/cystathionine gamma-synthase